MATTQRQGILQVANRMFLKCVGDTISETFQKDRRELIESCVICNYTKGGVFFSLFSL